MANNFDIEGLEDLVDFLDDMEISEQLERKTLNAMGDVALEGAKNNAPVDTGKLKNSIKKSVRKGEEGLIVEVGTNRVSASMTDWGTSKSRKNVGWFERGIDEVEDKILDAALESLEVLFR